MNVGRPADGGAEMTDVGGLVGERKPGGNALGGELAHLSTCSGFMGAETGLVGTGLRVFGTEGGWGGGVVARAGVALSSWLLLVVSDAHDCGLLAVVLPGEEAVAVLFSELPLCVLPSLCVDAAAAFSAFLHFALLFWNHTLRVEGKNNNIVLLLV